MTGIAGGGGRTVGRAWVRDRAVIVVVVTCQLGNTGEKLLYVVAGGVAGGDLQKEDRQPKEIY